MEYPKFYDSVEPFILQDDLAAFLGATKGGEIQIDYIDCVKLAGHSCPTVAGSYILAKVALNKLYGNEIPKRSQVKIEFKEAKEHQVTGVIGSVLSFILGSNDSGGFAGIGGKFNRKNLLSYENNDVNGMVKFTRIDNNESITLNLNTSIVPGDPNMQPLMQKTLMGQASKEEAEQFAKLWQARVEYMLLKPELWEEIAGF